MPKQKNVPKVIYNICKSIFSQNIEVSPLNQSYKGHCSPNKILRKELRKKFDAKFGAFVREQDDKIMDRFNFILAENEIPQDGNIVKLLLTTCKGKESEEIHETK